ncbi:hypothetical protein GCM10009802_15860 [Streptomyces synnematoformans]|uniref:Uncharacterized protein n=1 Tax=Streptomyces synnematoformans TaxID=415721 RepID=A0ABN2XS80_9ACTN
MVTQATDGASGGIEGKCRRRQLTAVGCVLLPWAAGSPLSRHRVTAPEFDHMAESSCRPASRPRLPDQWGCLRSGSGWMRYATLAPRGGQSQAPLRMRLMAALRMRIPRTLVGFTPVRSRTRCSR